MKNIWKEKLDYKYHISQKSFLREKWIFEDILNSIKTMHEISEFETVSPNKNPANQFSKELFCLKLEIEETIQSVSEQLQIFPTNSSVSLLNNFKEILRKFTT